jgi:hypothetical protein
MLTLYEDLYLLALDERRGNLVWFARKPFIFPAIGLILAELALAGKLTVGDKLRLVAAGSEMTGDPILDEVLEEIRSSDKPHKPTYWISQFSGEGKKFRQRIGERLVEKNILIQDEKRFYRKEAEPGSDSIAPEKFQLKLELRAPVLAGGEVDLRKTTLLKMIAAGNLLNLIFTEDEIEIAERFINKQLLTSALGNPVMQLVEEIGQAVSTVGEDEME